MLGTFALSEVMARFAERVQKKEIDTIRLTSEELGTSAFKMRQLIPQWFNLLRSSIVGTVMGFVPGLGSTLASFVTYGLAKSTSRNPEKFGKGTLEGIIAPETGNNAVTGGAMIPLLTLGIPGGAATAVMLATFLYKGVSPGPMIFMTQPVLVGKIMVSMLLANFLVLFVGRKSQGKIFVVF
jgi:putative tricarboxylic transport membrane protein